MTAEPAVSCEGIQFTYEFSETPTLSGIDLEIARGEFAVIAGPSGAGKSTFCRTLNNIIPLFFHGSLNGNRRVAGISLAKQSVASLSRLVGIVFQDFEQQLFCTSSLLDLTFGMENFGIPPEEMQRRVDQLMAQFNLDRLSKREPFTLSGGEKQKLAIASVLACRPEILILDEPTTDLDPESREFVLQILPGLKDWVETLIVVDHETEYFQSAQKLFLLNQGKISASGSAFDILTNRALLESNSLASLDGVQIRESLGLPLALSSPAELAHQLNGYRLEPIPPENRTSSPAVIELMDLTFRYPGQSSDALHDLSFEIREGEFAAVIGHNGSGKSTLLRHLNGLQFAQKGSVRVRGKETRQWGRKELAKTVGLVFQNPDHQIFEASVKAEVEFGPRQFGFPDDEVRKNSLQAIQIMDLEAQADRDPFTLSKGERQRVAVASLLSIQPDILVLDEPTTGLDDRQQKHLMNLLRELNRKGKTILIVTHALRLVAEFCNYAILLDRGAKIAEGHPREALLKGPGEIKLPFVLELSKTMGGNALTASEFLQTLKKNGGR